MDGWMFLSSVDGWMDGIACGWTDERVEVGLSLATERENPRITGDFGGIYGSF